MSLVVAGSVRAGLLLCAEQGSGAISAMTRLTDNSVPPYLGLPRTL